MTSRDLIQQRTTLSNGDTVWKNSPLVDAALHGKLAILDGINRIDPSTLAILHRYTALQNSSKNFVIKYKRYVIFLDWFTIENYNCMMVKGSSGQIVTTR